MPAVKVEVVLGKVGERPDGERGFGHPAEGQGMARYLRCNPFRPGVAHLREQPLEVRRLRGGVGVDDRLGPEPGDDGSDETATPSGGRRDCFEQEGDGGLAVGPGHPDHVEGLRGQSWIAAAMPGEDRPGVGDVQGGEALVTDMETQRPASAVRLCLGDEVVAIPSAAGHSDKEAPGSTWRLSMRDIGHDGVPGSPVSRRRPVRPASPIVLPAAGIGCHSQPVQRLFHDLGERRGGRQSAGSELPDRAVDHHRHNDLGIVDRGQADKARHGDVDVAAVVAELVGRSGLAPDHVAGDLGRDAGPGLDHLGEQLSHGRSGLGLTT